MIKRAACFVPLIAVAACKPPATDDYVERIAINEQASGPSAPIDSPDTEGAVWGESDRAGRIIYGKPGDPPMLALACNIPADGAPTVTLTRFVSADPQAKALVAIIGNGHMARLPIDATWNGRVWLWEGTYPATSSDLGVFTGSRAIEVTIPGAGSVVVNPAQRPARLLEMCRQAARLTPQPEQPDSPA